jgi:hypothetical protein
MAAEDGNLMPQCQQLEIALGLCLSAEQEYGHQQPGQSIDGREEHERHDSRDSSPASSRRYSPADYSMPPGAERGVVMDI